MEIGKESEGFNIRKAQNDDLEKIYSFEREYIIEHESDQLSKWDLIKEKTMGVLRYNLGRMFVATVDGKLVGHGYWDIYFEEPCICSIFILKVYRNIGIATGLMKVIENQIFKKEYSKVNLSTLEINSAQYLFNKLNYTVIETKDGWIHYSKRLNKNAN
jgi:GNAT superfamily N-acetyltransferase